MSKPWRCRLGWHKMQRKFAANSESPSTYYYECARCGKFKDVPYRPPASYLGM